MKCANRNILHGLAIAVALCLGQPLTAQSTDPQSEGIIRVGHQAGPLEINPAFVADTVSHRLVINLFEGLVINLEGIGIVPAIAESWTISDDARIYRFKIRDNAAWSDGTPITAASAAESFRLLASMTGSAANFDFSVLDVNVATTDKGDLLEFTLPEPTPELLSILATAPASLLPVHLGDEIELTRSWGGGNLPEKMVFSGAYVLESISDGRIQLRPNPQYYAPNSIQNDGVDLVDFDEQDQRAYRDIRTGNIDLAVIREAGQAKFIRESFADFYEVIDWPSIEMVTINVAEGPLSDPDIRRALALATHFASNEVEIEARSFSTPHDSFVPPSLSASFDIINPEWVGLPIPERVQEARAIMESKGYSQENPLRIGLNSYHEMQAKRISQVLRAHWSEIHVEIDINVLSWEDHIDALLNHNYETALIDWVFDYGHMTSILKMFVEGRPFNISQFSNPEFDDLVARIGVTANLEQANDLNKQALAILYDEVPSIPISAGARVLLRQPELKINSFEFVGSIHYKSVYYPGERRFDPES